MLIETALGHYKRLDLSKCVVSLQMIILLRDKIFRTKHKT